MTTNTTQESTNIAIRPIRIVGDVAYVTLTRGYEAVIDAADVPLVAGFNWQAKVDRNTVYAVRTDRITGRRHHVLMHRFLLGASRGIEVDHEDGDGLNNRRVNLRMATHHQNMLNQRIRSNNTSGFKGVNFHKRTQKWRAQIRVEGRLQHLGLFTTPESAHKAYCKASAEFHGEFGRVT